jgi:hypothetical protein
LNFFIILPFTLLNRSLSFHHWSFSGRNVRRFQNRPRISSTARSNNNRLETWQFGFSYISRRNILIENHQLVKRWWKKINTPDIQSSPFFIWLFIDELRTFNCTLNVLLTKHFSEELQLSRLTLLLSQNHFEEVKQQT